MASFFSAHYMGLLFSDPLVLCGTNHRDISGLKRNRLSAVQYRTDPVVTRPRNIRRGQASDDE